MGIATWLKQLFNPAERNEDDGGDSSLVLGAEAMIPDSLLSEMLAPQDGEPVLGLD